MLIAILEISLPSTAAIFHKAWHNDEKYYSEVFNGQLDEVISPQHLPPDSPTNLHTTFDTVFSASLFYSRLSNLNRNISATLHTIHYSLHYTTLQYTIHYITLQYNTQL